jgi:hypothetical protein
MKIVSLKRRIRRAPVLWIAALVVACSTGTALAAASGPQLAGTWSGKYGGAFSGSFTLHWKQTESRLVGTIKLSNPPGTYGITGSVRGSAIKFGAVAVGATYTGSVSGKSMSGKYKTPQGGGSWSARKTSSKTS